MFLLQAAILWFVSLPLQAALAEEAAGSPLGWLDAAGSAVWTIGMLFETVGDWQLARFRADLRMRGESWIAVFGGTPATRITSATSACGGACT